MNAADSLAIIAAARALLNDVRAMQSTDHEFEFDGFEEADFDENGHTSINWPNLAISADVLALALGEPAHVPEWDRSSDNA